jgi:imidazolonepropionase
MEIKSGYGLDVKSELKQLRAIKILQQELPIQLVPTFLGAHAIPPEYKENRKEYIRLICEEMIPQVADENLAVYCDVFTEKGYFTVKESEKILQTALNAGLKLKVHGNEFTNMGAVKMAAKLGATSIDHLIQANDEDISIMKGTGLIACLLPGTSFFLNEDYAPARKFIDNDVIVAIATDCNPGSCYCENMQMIISIACLQMRMTMEEALTATTLNAAHSVGLSAKYGSLEVGKNANFSIVNSHRYTDMIYHYGSNRIGEVWVNGKREIVNY